MYWQQKAQRFSDLYTNTNIPFFPSSIVACFLKDRTDTLLSFLPPTTNSHILDVGCGSGPHMRILSPRCKKITGIDYSRQMLDLARATLMRTPKKNWRLVLSDASHIPFPKQTFDCIIAMGLLDYVHSPLAVLTEFRRVIKSRGTIIVSIPKKPSYFSILRNPLGDWIKNVVFHLPPIDNTMTKNEFQTLMAHAGFRIIAVKSIWSSMWMIKLRPHEALKKRKIATR